MNHGFRWPLLAILLCGLAVSCSSAPEDPTGPAGTVKQFYSHLNDGHYADAVALYGADAMAIVQDPEGALDPGFAEWAGLETRKGQVDKVNVLEELVEEESATVRYEVVYEDGTTKQGTVTLTREADLWKLGMIG